ncbi:uncharacterized protein MONBRDRAFT_1907, partial [Monosiga brevicollis MX1]
RVRTAHVCEAPGGFIACTSHYLRELHGEELDHDWVGMTLNPHYEDNNPVAMVDSDAWICDTIEHWDFGADDSGDLMQADNVRSLWARVAEIGKVDLFTGDGSVDCQHDPNEQENITAMLHYCEAVAGLGCLRRGGAMVLKTFTFFEACTNQLVYLLGVHFDEVWISKPACSRASNAETYLV